MWFGTVDGLNRYDGYNFKIYKNDLKNQLSISGNNITSIAEDNLGQLWIGTRNNGFNIFNRSKEEFTRFNFEKGNKLSLSNNAVRTILIDSKNRVWIGTLGGGLDLFDKNNKSFINFKYDLSNPNSISDDYVYSIIEDSSGILWIGTESGNLDQFDFNNNKFTHYTFDKNYRANRQYFGKILYKEGPENLWIGVDGKGAYRFNIISKKFKHFEFSLSENSLKNTIVTSFYKDKNGNIWIGTDGGGINIYSAKTNTFQYINNNANDLNSISNNSVYNIFEDNSGTIWIGTFRGGLNIFNECKYKFKLYTQIAELQNCLSFKSVIALYQDKEKNIWVGTDGGGLNLFDKKNETFKHFKNNPYDRNSISSNVVKAIYEDSKGNLWLGTYAKGLNMYNKRNNSFINFMNNPEDTNSIGHNNVWAIYEDRQNNLWIGLMGGGLDLFDREQKIFRHHIHDNKNPKSISSNNVKTIFEDKNGDFWIGTEGGGLNLFDRKSDGFTYYTNNQKDTTSISNNDIMAIYQDRRSSLWIGTADGLCKFNKDKGTFCTMRISDGLPSNIINGILEDNSGYLWISTNKGLSKFNTKNNTFRNYDINDGLQGNEFNYTTQLKSSTGEMYFGGINGFNSFFPDEIADNQYMPNVTITDFKLFGKSLRNNDLIHNRILTNNSISEVTEIIFTHKENLFSFEFSALQYIAPLRNKYAYKMEGFDSSWIYTDATDRTVTYMNLGAGSYVFHVKASNSDGIWPTNEKTINVIILPPWWNTIWFKFIFFIIVASAIINFSYLRVRTLKKQKKVLEQKVKERTVELMEANVQLEKKQKEILHQNVIILEKNEKIQSNNKLLSEFNLNLEEKVNERTNELKESEERNRTILHTAMDGFWLTNIQGNLLEVNETYCRMSGYSKEELLLMNIHDLEAIESANKTAFYIKNIIEKGEDRFLSQHCRKDGSIFDVEISVQYQPAFNERFVFFLRDITERKQAEKDLIKAKEKAEESDRLKSAFLRNMSHEVRTPLNGVEGFSKLMAKPNLTQEKIKKYSETIISSSEKIIQIITDVIEISQIQANQVKVKMTEFNLFSLINEILAKFNLIAKEKNIELLFNKDDSINEFYILSDRKKLETAFFHLIDNAFKFTSHGSVEISCEIKQENVNLTVTDTGIGISDEMLNLIFDPFRQVETGVCRNFGGNGLGLAIIKAYIELLNGTVSLKSEVNKGSAFLISIPIIKIKRETTKLMTNKPNALIDTILIAEDEYSNYEYLLEVFDETKLKILFAADGQQALDMCRANSSVSLVLMDIKMPLMDGYTAAQLIKSFRPDMIIIAQTAYALESEKEKFIGVFDDYISKPINEDELKQVLIKYIDIQ